MFSCISRYKDSDPVQPSVTISIVNEGTELRISQIKNEDIGGINVYLILCTCSFNNQINKLHKTNSDNFVVSQSTRVLDAMVKEGCITQ